MLAGVAAGVAETLDADPSLVRILWALLAILTGGIALLVYIVMAIVVPEAPDQRELAAPPSPSTTPPAPGSPVPAAAPVPPSSAAMPTRAEWRTERRAARRARRHDATGSGEAGLIFGVVLIVIGGLFLARQVMPWFGFHLWWPIGIVALGVLLIVVAVRPGRPTE
jgi:phage shock protein PspC (stress-responsive transcriptional regulator)